jgi:hypothetical protein
VSEGYSRFSLTLLDNTKAVVNHQLKTDQADNDEQGAGKTQGRLSTTTTTTHSMITRMPITSVRAHRLTWCVSILAP